MRNIELYYEPTEILGKLASNKSEMSERELSFLCGLIKKYRPHKIVEIGVAAGGTTSVVLNCISILGLDSETYSLDLSDQYYRDKERNTGYLIEECKKTLKNKKLSHTLKTGNYAVEYLGEIGKNIDFLIMDTVHSLPGEILDFLAYYPFLNKECVVVLHDITLNHCGENLNGFATKLLLDVIVGEKVLDIDENSNLANIGAVILNEDTSKYIEDIFSALTITWTYKLSCKELELYREHYKKYYPDGMLRLFDIAVKINDDIYNARIINKQNEFLQLYNWMEVMKSKRVYIYGCGNFGKQINELLDHCGIILGGYIISDGEKKKEGSEEVFYLSEADIDIEKDIILIGVNNSLRKEICLELEKRGMYNYIFPNDYMWNLIK